MDGDGLTVDPLFLACTRPAMWQGVPVGALAANFSLTCIIFIIMGNPAYLSIGVVVHYVVRAFISKDYNFFVILMLWGETKAKARNIELWGGSSISPIPLRRARKPREVRSYV
ncbi:type IV secretion system protein VirB3 [Methylobacterium radiotolerans]|uniref:type IV secretion system protein VirB3 n=1 Tax=Methylobacterium radiotolerans TaxID=31998 RepID=UPI0009766037|nr:type IV secretion system protein VirB3 [Methylobacterium radiotolerans]ONF49427.1 type IV secretion protein VirB3 [Methylobacterium radiotolerans]